MTDREERICYKAGKRLKDTSIFQYQPMTVREFEIKELRELSPCCNECFIKRLDFIAINYLTVSRFCAKLENYSLCDKHEKLRVIELEPNTFKSTKTMQCGCVIFNEDGCEKILHPCDRHNALNRQN